MSKIGFIGTGNMGSAVACAMAKNNSNEFYFADVLTEKASSLADKLNGTVSTNQEIASVCDYVVLAVKPQMMKDVFNEIRDILNNRTSPFTIVTMAAGITINSYYELSGNRYPIIRIMPNTPVSVSEGVITYCANEYVEEECLNEIVELLKNGGMVEEIKESLMSVAGTVAGCGPAFVDMFIEALADGGVAQGLPRDKAYKFAAQMIKGSAKLFLETGKATSTLKDEVCSPGGTTIQGVRVLEERAFRAAVMDAVINADEATKKLNK